MAKRSVVVGDVAPVTRLRKDFIKLLNDAAGGDAP